MIRGRKDGLSKVMLLHTIFFRTTFAIQVIVLLRPPCKLSLKIVLCDTTLALKLKGDCNLKSGFHWTPVYRYVMTFKDKGKWLSFEMSFVLA